MKTTTTTVSIGIIFGAICPSISEQLEEQKFKFSKKEVEKFQDVLKAIHTLRFADMLPDTEKDKLIGRLYKKIVSHVCKANKLSNPKKNKK
jgi:hypothetical protein